MAELKPCPMCGEEVRVSLVFEAYYQIKCTKCPLEYGRFWFAKGQKRMLYQSWNRRAGETNG